MARWLPGLVLMSDYGNNWNRYVDVLYSFYRQDFARDKTHYYGKKLSVKKYLLIDNKEATFGISYKMAKKKKNVYLIYEDAKESDGPR